MDELNEQRSYQVAKSNELYRQQEPGNLVWLIQKCGNQLTLAEMKLVSFLISKVKPKDTELQLYEISVRNFCETCGLSYKSGKNYERIQKMIKTLADKSEWVKDEKGRKILFRWIETPIIDSASGKIFLRLNQLLTKYVLQLHKNYFQYELVFVLPLKSAYSFRLYELAKSYSHLGGAELTVEELQEFLCVPDMEYKKFNQKILKKSIDEINNYTDLHISAEPIRKGRKVERLKITVEKLNYFERDKNYQRTKKELDGEQEQQIPGQMDLNDFQKTE